jgi:hypothetical protein
MPFDWMKFLDVARFLQAQDGTGVDEEAAKRCATSRAYFAAYCCARNYARDKLQFVPSRQPDDHEALRRYLGIQGRRSMTSVANKLVSLRMWRNQCDYDDTVPNLLNMLSSAISTAQAVVNSLQP